MRVRKQAIGNRNIVGQRVEEKRKSIGLKQKDFLTMLQIAGIDLNASGLSKLEGQIRSVSDKELIIIAKTLEVSVLWLLGLEDEVESEVDSEVESEVESEVDSEVQEEQEEQEQ